MAVCGGCGASTTRTTTSINKSGDVVEEICPSCRPDRFADPFSDPSDRKVWAEHLGRPHLYRTMSDGSIVAKDELLADMDAVLQSDPDAEAREKLIAAKRASRRTEPMTRTEIEQADRKWRPVYQEWSRQQDAALRDYNAELDKIVERHFANSESV